MPTVVEEVISTPSLTLPEDKRSWFEDKLKEYRGRDSSYRHPDLEPLHPYKVAILSELLAEGKADRAEMEAALRERMGEGFSSPNFDQAWGVIADYVLHNGEHCRRYPN